MLCLSSTQHRTSLLNSFGLCIKKTEPNPWQLSEIHFARNFRHWTESCKQLFTFWPSDEKGGCDWSTFAAPSLTTVVRTVLALARELTCLRNVIGFWPMAWQSPMLARITWVNGFFTPWKTKIDHQTTEDAWDFTAIDFSGVRATRVFPLYVLWLHSPAPVLSQSQRPWSQ